MDGNAHRGTLALVVLSALVIAGCIGAGGSVDSDVTRDASEAYGTATALWIEKGMVLEDADASHWSYANGHISAQDHQENLTQARAAINAIEDAIVDESFHVEALDHLMQRSVHAAHGALNGILACGANYECPSSQEARTAFFDSFDDLTEGMLEQMAPQDDPRPG